MQTPSCRYHFHPNTLARLEYEVKLRMVCYPTQHYLKPLYLTIDYHKDKGGVVGLYCFLEQQVVHNLIQRQAAVTFEQREHYSRLIINERKSLAAILIISRHLYSGKKGEYTHAFNATEKTRARGDYQHPRLSQGYKSLCTRALAKPGVLGV